MIGLEVEIILEGAGNTGLLLNGADLVVIMDDGCRCRRSEGVTT